MSTTTATQAIPPVTMTRLASFGVLAAIVASVANVLVRGAGVLLFDVPGGVGPFGVGPVITTTVIGVVGATGVYGVLSRVSKRPVRTFVWIGAVVLVLSFVPLLAPPAFLAEAPATVLGTFGLMHVTTAGIVLAAMMRAEFDGANRSDL